MSAKTPSTKTFNSTEATCLNCAKATVDCASIPLDGMMEWPCPACGYIFALTRSSRRAAQMATTGKRTVDVLVMFKVDRGSEEPMYVVLPQQLTARTGFSHDAMLAEIRDAHSKEFGPDTCISLALGMVMIVGNDDHAHHLFTYVNTIIEPTRAEYANLIGLEEEELDPDEACPFVLDAPTMRRLFGLDGPAKIKHLH